MPGMLPPPAEMRFDLVFISVVAGRQMVGDELVDQLVQRAAAVGCSGDVDAVAQVRLNLDRPGLSVGEPLERPRALLLAS